ncbi:MAG: class I SAM-dependent methyltransferase [Actinomycetaceae bacterium]|nr:class I SAM-dependent methyltransferase [Actinomycetaceae bacterium]
MATWDERYRQASKDGSTLFSTEPSQAVKRALSHVKILTRHRPHAIDVGAGEGRHSAYLAELGYLVTALEPSGEGIRTGQMIHSTPAIEWVHADTRGWTPDELVDLVLIAYLHPIGLSIEEVLRDVHGWIKPGGWLALAGHSRAQFGLPVPGPKDADRLWELESVKSDLVASGYELVYADDIPRRDKEHCAETVDSNSPLPIDTIITANKIEP